MSPDIHIFLTCALSLGVPLLLAIRELVVLGRYDAGGSGKGGEVPERAPAPAPAGDEPSLPPLPSCLIEALRGDPGPSARPAPAPPVRILERA